jgi:hypothetical protein
VSIKTLHFTNCWHSESGGIATFYRELMHAAERHGRQIRLVVPGARDRVEECGPFARIYHVAGSPSRLSPGYRLLMPSEPNGPHRLGAHGPTGAPVDTQHPHQASLSEPTL